MSETNDFSLIYSKESAWDEVPSTPSMTKVRVTGENLVHNKTTTESEEITGDGQVADLIETAVGASGPINIEKSYRGHVEFLEGAMKNDEVTIDIDAESTTIVAAARTYTRGSGSWITDGIVPGSVVKVATAVNGGNNGSKVVDTVSALVLTLNARHTELVDEGPVVLDYDAIQLPNGTTKSSYLLQKDFGIASVFTYMRGARVNTFQETITAGQKVTGNYGLMASQFFSSASDLDAAPSEAPTNTIQNASSDFAAIYKDGVVLSPSAGVTGIVVNGTHNLRGPAVLGQKGAGDVRYGTFQVTGTVNAFLGQLDQMSDYIDHASLGLHWNTNDGAGNEEWSNIPKLYWTGGFPVAGGRNQDVVVGLNFTAVKTVNANQADTTMVKSFINA